MNTADPKGNLAILGRHGVHADAACLRLWSLNNRSTLGARTVSADQQKHNMLVHQAKTEKREFASESPEKTRKNGGQKRR